MSFEKYGKRRAISFRVTEVAWDRIEQASQIFGMQPSQLCKALIYLHLQIFDQPLDQRRHFWKKKVKE